MSAPLDLHSTYLHLQPDHSVRPIEVTPDFWATISQRQDLADGRLLMTFSYSENWSHWEMHPDGDEVVAVIAGSMTLLLEQAGGVKRVSLAAGQTAVVPRGVWHTGEVDEPCTAMFVTAGQGTQHRGA